MKEVNFIDELNGLKSLSDRFDLLRNSYSVILDGNDAEVFHLADYKVLCSSQNYNSMNKEYSPFMQGNEYLSEDERLFIERYRIGQIKEPLIEAFYCGVLCNAQNKPNAKYAEILIENYLKVVSNQKNYKPVDVLWAMKSLMFNCKKYCKQREENIVNAVDLLLASDISLMYKYRLLVCAFNFGFLKAPQIMSYASNYKLFDSISESYFDNERFFKVLHDCTPKNDKTTIRVLYHRLAENEDIIINQSPLNSTISANLLRKCQYLESAGLSEEAEKANKQYIIAKSSRDGIVTVKMSVEVPNSFFQHYIDKIITSPYPFATLAEDDSLLPSLDIYQDDLLPKHQELGTQLSYIDINGNPHSGNGFYRDKIGKLSYYNLYELIPVYPITRSLRQLIEQGRFSENELLGYLSSTWLSQPRLTVNSDLRKSQESWMDSLRPSIHSLCLEITSEIMSEGKLHGNYMSAIDSLVLKIEGCLREACWRLGINTVNPENNDEVTFEKILQKIDAYQKEHDVLIISSSSLDLLENIFTKKGINLRNNIAHGLTSLSDYNINKAITVLHCLLKVSTMKVASSSND